MRRRSLHMLLFAVLLAGIAPARAQYYDWGADPASIRWRQLRTPDIRVIYPEPFDEGARRVLHYLQVAGQDIGFGFRHGPMKTPVVLHTQNFRSNGITIWAPRRIEMLAIPDIETYSMPWLKQLAAHEYRHNVQQNNLNRATNRVFYYLLGQQGAFESMLFLPLWFMEGDAVMMETEMSTYGRGLQPSFTIGYRAAIDEVINTRTSRRDKWFSGSFRDYVPDHYRLGYQIASYSYTKFGRFIWDDVAAYGARNPFTIATVHWALRKYCGTSVDRLFRETFEDLGFFWGRQPATPDSSRILPTPVESYTTYRHPLFADAENIVALKLDYDTPDRFVRVDPQSGRERHLAFIGQLSTRPVLAGNRLWWTEYRRSTLWPQRVNSQLCYMDLRDARPRILPGRRNVLYPTAVSATNMVWVEYGYDGSYSIVQRSAVGEQRMFRFPRGVQLHGLAWDEPTKRLYFIALDDRGMWIGSVDHEEHVEELTAPAYVTLSDLRAADGRLYFGSIASGKDEAHMLDLQTRKQYRLSTSRFGSFAPAPSPDGDRVAMTTYARTGYRLAVQNSEPGTWVEVVPAAVPEDRVNPPRRRWDVVNLDTVRFDDKTLAQSHRATPTRHYYKAAHLVKVHSWAPADFNPYELLGDGINSEQDNEINLGATVISQNLISSMTTYLAYGWDRSRGSMLKGGLRYYGLGPVIEFEGQYGGGKQIVYTQNRLQSSKPLDPGMLKTFSTFTTRLSLPIQIKAGYHTRYLTPAVEWERNNGLLYNESKQRFTKGIDKMTASLQIVDNTALAYRDFLPQWGYALRAAYTINPLNEDFSPLWSLFARVYVPGFAKHHTLTLRGAYQQFTDTKSNLYGFQSKVLFPRGAKYDFRYEKYGALAADYQLPLFYPDWGISSILFIRRIRLNLGYNYARYYGSPYERNRNIFKGDYINPFQGAYAKKGWHTIHSFGCDVIFDVNLFRSPDAATTSFRISIFKPSSRRGIRISAGVALPI